MNQSPDRQQDDPTSAGRGLRFLLALGLTIAVSVLFHGPILRFIGSQLVCDEAGIQLCSHVLPLSGDRRFDRTAQLLSDNRALRALVLQPGALRTEQAGAVQRPSELAIRNLTDRGVDRSKIDVASGSGHRRWDKAKIINGWLEENPGSNVLILCDELHTRSDRVVVDRLFSQDRSRRVVFQALQDRRFNASNWWTSRVGLKVVFFCYVALVYAHVGEATDTPKYLTPDEYERASLRLLGVPGTTRTIREP